MRVLQLSTWETQCGIADYASSLRAALDAQGIDTGVWPIDRIAMKYMSRSELSDYFADVVAAARAYDVVHIQHEFSFFGGEYGIKASIDVFAEVLAGLRRQAKPTVITCHSHPRAALPRRLSRIGMPFELYCRARLRNGFRGNTHVIAHNRLTRRALIDLGVAAERIDVVPIGVPTGVPVSEQRRAEAKKAIGFPPITTVLAMFGFLVPSKGHVTALEALALLPDSYRLLIVGGGHPQGTENSVDEIREFLHRSPNVAPRVKITGFVPADQIGLYYDAVDIHIAPYTGRVLQSGSAAIANAIGSGRPVIASRIPPFQELNDMADCLWLTSPEAPYELQSVIEEALRNEDRRKQLVANGESYAAANSWAASARRHIELYSSIV